MKIVRCERCGREYEMPDIGIEKITMKTCPTCVQIEKTMKEMGIGK